MKNGKLRVLTILIALAMLLAAMPNWALAAEASHPVQVRVVSEKEFGEQPVDAVLHAHYTSKKITSLKLSKSTIKIETGQTYRIELIATGTGAKPDFNNVTSSSSNKHVVSVIYRAQNGNRLYYNIVGIGPGVTKLSLSLEGKTASANVKVSEPETGSIRLSSSTLSMIAGQTAQLEAYLYPNTTSSKVKWKSSNAKVVHIASDGTVTARKKGSATLTAVSGKYQAKCSVKVGGNETDARYFRYEIKDGYATITKYFGSFTHVIVPSVLDGYPVLHIGEKAFYSNWALASIVLPNDLVSIGKNAFESCQYLQTVVLPDSLKTIEYKAFLDCVRLRDVMIPSGLEYLGAYAFAGCHSLREIVLPERVVVLNNYLFEANSKLSNVVIPDSVTHISTGVFSLCSSLVNIKLPSSLREIARRAFNSCRNLKSIVIPNNVTTIGEEAFRLCDRLEVVVLGTSVQSVGDRAFSSCYDLVKISIPRSVSSISDTAFKGSSNVTIYGQRNSYANEYANRLGIPFVAE